MPVLARTLDGSFTSEFVGFAYEGAGLYFGMLDMLVPRFDSRLDAFTHSVAAHHDYIVTVGAGLAIARAPFGPRRLRSYQHRLDPMSAWCLADGYGFHQGFFEWKRFIQDREHPPARLTLQSRRLFDAGVGRAMWWVFGADPSSIAKSISRFDIGRQEEMWTGVGTALAYAGAGPVNISSVLLSLAGPYRLALLSGISLAAHMREKGGNPADWTKQACRELLGLTVNEASELVVTELSQYLARWEGPEQDKWSNCYVALQYRLKKRLENLLSEKPAPAAMAKADCEEKSWQPKQITT